MKKFNLLSTFVIISCAKDESSSLNSTSSNLLSRTIGLLESKIILKSSTNYLSSRSHDIGVSSIQNVTRSNDSYTFQLVRFSKMINGIDLSAFKTFKVSEVDGFIELEFVESNNKLQIDSDKNILMYFDDNILPFSDSEVEKLSDTENTEVANLLVLFDLVTNPENDMSQYVTSEKKTCDWIAMTVYSTRSRAEYKLEALVETFLAEHSDCKKVGSGDSGCLWEDYGFVASQGFECNGSTCN
jgi:hypothetical protein